MKSKYLDIPATIQVIGGIYQNPELLDMEDKYHFYAEDFPEEFHKVLFGAIYNLYQLGAKEIDETTIENYLEQRPKKLGIYKANKGSEYLEKIKEILNPPAFDYYYSRVKKMTLFRMYESIGMDLSSIYDVDNILDIKKKQKQEEWVDNHTLTEIADAIDLKISNVRLKYVENNNEDFAQGGDRIFELIDELERSPEFGVPLYGKYINTIFRGARLKKFYLRSASTGLGKSRSMIADACYIAVDKIYDMSKGEWTSNGLSESTLFISTEQEVTEIQTMMLAFVSGVNEEHIITGRYDEGEKNRVLEAAAILQRAPLHIKTLPDFSLQDIENAIKYSIREWDVKYVFHDYIHSSMKILSEIGSKSGVKGLREDNILFMISVRLKDLCNQYEVFIMSATQLNAGYMDADVYDQNLLRGAKSIADKIDAGSIMIKVTEEDRAAIKDLVALQGCEMPTIKMSVYKNRRGRYKDILLWCSADLGTCRINPLFVTDYSYEILDVPDVTISRKNVDIREF